MRGVLGSAKVGLNEYQIPDSDETVTLDFTYQFLSEGSKFSSQVVTNRLHTDEVAFSSNGTVS